MVAVGTVTVASVRLWARLERPSDLALRLEGPEGKRAVSLRPSWGEQNTCAFTYPNDFPGEAPLRAGTRYRFTVATAEGDEVGQGRFKTPPAQAQDAPARWTLAFMSCHQPFGSDGAVTEDARRMLKAAEDLLAARDVELVLFLGDQVYADAPEALSLFASGAEAHPLIERTAAEVRAAYHHRYLHAWHIPSWQRLHACAATACLPDDHEIIDNWGSDEAHGAPAWQKVGHAALDVAFAWQGLRSFAPPRPPTFQQSFRWGNAGVFMLDTRSQRRNDGTTAGSCIIAPSQETLLETFLRANADLPVLLIGVTVPLVHLPDWLTSMGAALSLSASDLADRWSNPVWVDLRDRLLRRLDEHRQRHPHQKIVLLSGDIHAGWAVRFVHADEDAERGRFGPGHPVVQLVSSAVSNGDNSWVGALSEALLHASKLLAGKVAGLALSHLAGVEGARENPFGGLNVGLLEIAAHGAEAELRFQIVSHAEGPRGPEPHVVFDSGPF